MIFDVAQSSKTLTGSSFFVAGPRGALGDAMAIPVMPNRVRWFGRFLGRPVAMEPGPLRFANRDVYPLSLFSVSAAGLPGEMCRTMLPKEPGKHSWLGRPDVYLLRLGGTEYTVYPVAARSLQKGWAMANCIYVGDRQVAEVREPSTVRNMMYMYRSFVADSPGVVDVNGAAVAAFIVSCYVYATKHYVPGDMASHSVRKTFERTIDGTLLSRFNPNFVLSVAP